MSMIKVLIAVFTLKIGRSREGVHHTVSHKHNSTPTIIMFHANTHDFDRINLRAVEGKSVF